MSDHPQLNVEPPVPVTPREIAIEGLFVQFVGMGPGRKYGALTRESKVPTTELIRHASKFLWRERIAVIHCEANERTRDELVETIADINTRHISKLKVMQTKAFEYLEKVALDKPADAIKLLTLAMKMEREAVGLDQNSEQARLSDLLMGKMEKLLDAPKSAKVITVEPEFPDPDTFDADTLIEPGSEE